MLLCCKGLPTFNKAPPFILSAKEMQEREMGRVVSVRACVWIQDESQLSVISSGL